MLAGVMTLALVYGVYRGFLYWRIAAGYRAVRRAGYPTTLAELDAWYSIPQGAQNAADEVMKAAGIVEILERKSREYLGIGKNVNALWNCPSEAPDEETFLKMLEEAEEQDRIERVGRVDYTEDDIPREPLPLPEAWRDAIGDMLSDCAEEMEHLRCAAAMDACRYPVDFGSWGPPKPDTEPVGNPLSHHPVVHGGAGLFQREAVLRCDSGDVDGAVESLVAGFRLARTLSEEPTVMAQLARAAAVARVASGLEWVMNHCQLSRNNSTSFKRPCSPRIRSMHSPGLTPENGVSRGGGFKVRYTRLEYSVAMLRNGKPPSWWSWRLLYEMPYKLAGMEQWEQIHFLKSVDGTRRILAMPEGQRPQAAKRFAAKTAAAASLLLVARTRLLSPDLVLGVSLQDISRQMLARTALALERYRLDHGALPIAWQTWFPSTCRKSPPTFLVTALSPTSATKMATPSQAPVGPGNPAMISPSPSSGTDARLVRSLGNLLQGSLSFLKHGCAVGAILHSNCIIAPEP